MSQDPRPPEPQTSARGPYRLAPIPSRHQDESRNWITRAAQLAAGGEAVVLGAGACEEIPLDELTARFKRVVLNDVDRLALERGLSRVSSGDSRRKIELNVADLTGTTRELVEKIEQSLATSADPDKAIDELVRLVDSHKVSGLELVGRFNLVVASCVLSQLHFDLTHQAGDRFAARFPGELERLRGSDRWKTALFQLARRVEGRFIYDLIALVAEGGVIYLSESVQMCFIQGTPDGQWQTAGTYRMLRSTNLADYLDARFTIAERARWQWVVSPPARPGETGRLFDVQALIVRLARPQEESTTA